MVYLREMGETACSCYEWCAVHDHGVYVCLLEEYWQVGVDLGIAPWLRSPLVVRGGLGDPEEDAGEGHVASCSRYSGLEYRSRSIESANVNGWPRVAIPDRFKISLCTVQLSNTRLQAYD